MTGDGKRNGRRVTLQIPDQLLVVIEDQVEKGYFVDRNHAIRAACRASFTDFYADDARRTDPLLKQGKGENTRVRYMQATEGGD